VPVSFLATMASFERGTMTAFRTTLLCLSLLTAVYAATPEETTIRNAYAKLSYVVDLESMYRAATANPQITSAELAKIVNDNSLRFTLSNFVVGNLSDITTKKFMAVFPQYPDDVMIQITAVRSNHEEDGKTTVMDAAAAQWAPGPNGVAPDWTVAQMLPVMEKESGSTDWCATAPSP
jgi:hypothetical protein